MTPASCIGSRITSVRIELPVCLLHNRRQFSEPLLLSGSLLRFLTMYPSKRAFNVLSNFALVVVVTIRTQPLQHEVEHFGQHWSTHFDMETTFFRRDVHFSRRDCSEILYIALMDALTIRATRSTKTAFSKELALPCLNLNSSLPDSAYVVLTCVHICCALYVALWTSKCVRSWAMQNLNVGKIRNL
jgi:hypothetical protein